MKRLFQRTLARRVFLVVLLAFVAVLVALQAYMFLEFRNSLAERQGLSRLGRALTEALAPVNDEAQVLTMLHTTDSLYKRLRISGNPAGTLLLQLFDDQGRLLYSSPGLGAQRLAGTPLTLSPMTIDGAPYWVYQSDAGRWSLRLAEPERTPMRVLRNNTRAVLPYVLLALPIVLLPVWLAVRLGLRPLRQLADRIAARDATDLTPLGLQPRHAELKPLVASLDALLGQLRQRLSRERAFVQDAAHELRTPMAVIAAQAHALSGAPTQQQRLEAQSQLEHAIARASHLTQQLLALATLDDAGNSARQEADVAQVLRQILAQTAPRAMLTEHQITLDAPDVLHAHLDVAAFQSIAQNLLDNAIAHTPRGTQIAVALHAADGALHLRVDDDGPGIPPAERALVFDRFHRRAGQDARGAGLGLAIVQQAARRMGGQVTLGDGLQGRGAGFHVVLPRTALRD